MRPHSPPAWGTPNVRDDGRGFDVAERVGKGFGIMQARAGRRARGQPYD